MKMLAPIAIFIYNRPDHLRRLIEDLKTCPEFNESEVIVFGDGPKSDGDFKNVADAREVAMNSLGSNATYRFSEINKGLADSIVAGVSEICAKYGRVIVLEDDLRISPAFLKFLNNGLERYQDDNDVFQISGHMFEVPKLKNYKSAILLPFTTTWGWATWDRAWKKFDVNAEGSDILQSDSSMRRKFNLYDRYNYARMLENFKNGKNNSWGIRWYWSVFQLGGVALYPPQSLVQNQGFDGSGTHGSGRFRSFGNSGGQFSVNADFLLPEVSIDLELLKDVAIAISRLNGGVVGKCVDILKVIQSKILL